MTIQDRRVGWLSPTFHLSFREILTHGAFRYAIACPIYCLMPDHMHLLWIGLDKRTDQLNAMKYFRKHLRSLLEELSFSLHYQSYDHVLREDERLETAFSNLAEYIARNPERKKLIRIDGFREYPYTSCLIPGYPELKPWQPDYWTRFWRVRGFLKRDGLFRAYDDKP